MRSLRPIRTHQLARGGFTLVEMLVSVALVLLIMTLFAQAFGIAASSIKKQRGLAENDQRARSMVTILLADLQKRTYRQREDAVTERIPLPIDVEDPPRTNDDRHPNAINKLLNAGNELSQGLVPLHPDYFIGGAKRDLSPAITTSTGGNGAAPREVDKERERGYFHYSEGAPGNDADDVLKLTVDVNETTFGNDDTTRLNGRAVLLDIFPPDSRTWENSGTPLDPSDDFPMNENQPIWDDDRGWVEDPDGSLRTYLPDEQGTASARYAEVVYFLRNGNLYRRVNLIREQELAIPGYGVDSLWNDFDHSVARADIDDQPVRFHGAAANEFNALDNTVAGAKTTSTANGTYPQHPHRYWSLGDPRNRFGFDNTVWPVDTAWPTDQLQGRPKEYLNPTPPQTFIGAWTHEETSHPMFGYPGVPGHSGGTDSPMRFDVAVPANAFDGGPRQGEDIVLSNCHAFDVKVWDNALSAFVDIGHERRDPMTGAPIGDLNVRAILDSGSPLTPPIIAGRFQGAQWLMGRYGGLTSNANRVFDTWHPAFNFTSDVREDPTGNPIVRPDNDPPPFRPLWSDRENFDTDMNRLGVHGSRPRFWAPGNTPEGTFIYDRNVPSASFPKVFPRPNLPDGPNTRPMPPHMSFFYVIDEARELNGQADFQTGLEQPNWPESPGATVQDGEIRWKAIPNVIGLRAIQITLRFFDPTSGQMRQLTLTHSFVEL